MIAHPRLRVLRVLAPLLLFAFGCASSRNTLAQDLAWNRWQKCNMIPGVQFKEIRRDGQIWVTYTSPSGLAEWRECDRKAGQEQPRQRIAGGSSSSGQKGLAASNPVASSANSAPAWRRGYEWAYRYEGAAGSGTYVWTVDRDEVADGHDCWVIKTGTRQIFYRKSDQASVKETVDGVVIRRDSPPSLRFAWPLEVGKTWEQSYMNERPKDRQTEQMERVTSVESEEAVTVPAGTFQTFKIVVRNKRTGTMVYEAWYAPAVMQVVKLREHLASGLREREMIAYKLR